MGEQQQIVSFKTVEITLPLDFLVKAIAFADYDPNSKLTWDVEALNNEEGGPNRIHSFRSSNKLKLQIERLSFNFRDGCHVWDIGDPILQEIPTNSGALPKGACNTENTWTFLENDKQTQTVVTVKPNVSNTRTPDIGKKRKVGRPRKVQGKTVLSESGINSVDVHQCTHSVSITADKPEVSPEITATRIEPLLQSVNNEVSSKLGGVNSSDHFQPLAAIKKKRYSLRGVKLNSDIMGAVKGIDTLGEDLESTTENENLIPSDNDTDCDSEVKREFCNSRAAQKRKIAGKEKTENIVSATSSKYSKLCVDWLPKNKRRQKRPGNIECRICKRKLCDYTGVHDHVKKKHSKRKGVAEYLAELESLKVEKCKTCGLACSDRKKLILHEDREHAKTAKCSKCEKSFKNLHTLRSHIRLMHLQERGLSLCHLCSASFKSSTTLKQHIDQVHFGNKYVQCDICSKKFYNGSQLRRHCRIHNLTESQKHECPTCAKRFVFAHNLKKHIQVVHSTHKEAYHCPYCGKGFGQKAGMLSHIQLVHFNIFPYSCKECKATFARAVMLIEHMKSYHKVPDFQVTEKPVKNGIYNKTAEDMFYCSYCKEGFIHKTRLVEHMHTDHSEAFPFRCESCNQGFLEKSFLVLHKMKAHGVLITDYQQEDSEKENKKHEILQVITAKEGYPSKIVRFGLQDKADKLITDEVSDFVQQTQDEDVYVAGTSGSFLLMEVVSGDSTCRYVIETPEYIGESGSVMAAQDIANLLLAAEQTIHEADGVDNAVDGTTEISLVIDGNQTVEEANTYKGQGEVVVEAAEGLYQDPEDDELMAGQGEPSNLHIQMEGSEEEIQVIALPSGDKTVLTSDLDLLQLAAMERVNVSEGQEDETVHVPQAKETFEIKQETG